MIAAALLKPASRGRVRLRSLDPGAAPEIDLGYYREPSDLDRIREGLRLADAAAADPAVASLTGGGPLGPDRRTVADAPACPPLRESKVVGAGDLWIRA